jgi:PKD repeat protein
MVQARPDLLHSDVNSVAYPAAAAFVAGPLSLSTQYHAQDGHGQYIYGYSGGPSAKAESKTADGITRGSYSYIDSNGIEQRASYVSDPVNGFRIAATNLPVQVSILVTDTPEVAAAKAAHSQAFNEAADIAAAAPDPSEAAVDASTVLASPAVPADSAVPVEEAAPATSATDGPAVPATYTYTAPGIVASANTVGSFSYSTQSIGPTYIPAFYSAVLPATFPFIVNELAIDTPQVATTKATHLAAHVEATERLFD